MIKKYIEESIKKLPTWEVFIATCLIGFLYTAGVKWYEMEEWPKETALVMMQWKSLGVPEEFEVIKYNQYNILFFYRKLYVRYKIDEEKNEVFQYYTEKLKNSGWKEKKVDETEIEYEKTYDTGEKLKTLKCVISYEGENIWDMRISFW